MGRGRDKTIQGSDIPNMSPQERVALGNVLRMPNVRVKGSAVVRGRDGNAKYENPKLAGQYGEDNVS